MKSTKSSINTRNSLINETIKQNWIIALIACLAYFMSGTLPIMMNLDHYDNVEYLIESTLNNSYIFYTILSCIFPVMIALGVFRYLHNKSSCLFAHSLPGTRNDVFFANIIAGAILLFLPILITGLDLLLVSNFTAHAGVISFKAVSIWLIRTLIEVSFVYGISIVAAVISGSAFVQLFMSCFLNGLPFTFLFIKELYNGNYLKGYMVDGNSYMAYYSPITYSYIENNETLNVLPLVYIVATIVFILFALFLYNKSLLEREENGMIFHTAADILSIIIAFIGTVIFGLIFSDFNIYGLGIFLIAIVIGSIISMIIARIIVEKKLSIITKRNIILYAASLLLTLVFLSFNVFDITGFEKEIPKKNQIEQINIKLNGSACTLESSNAINDILALHLTLIDSELSNNGAIKELTLEYKIKDSKPLLRHYYIPYEDNQGIYKSLGDVFENKEFKEKTKFSEEFIEKIVSIEMYDDIGQQSITIPDKLHQGLLNAINDDYEKITFKDYNDYADTNIHFSINLKSSNKYFESKNIDITKDYKSTIDFLLKNGYDITVKNNYTEKGILID